MAPHPSPYKSIGGFKRVANAARIVACVNACKGINPEAVPDLLAAMETLTAMSEEALLFVSGDTESCLRDAINAARAAIAKTQAQP